MPDTTSATPRPTRARQDPRWAKRWRLDRDRGIRRYADASLARDHVRQLLDKGASHRAIAQAAGLSVHVVLRVADDQTYVRRVNAARILAVSPRQIFDRAGNDFVPKAGAARRLEALAAIGHSPAAIAAAMGQDVTAAIVRNIRNARGGWISHTNYQRVVTAYEALWDQPGTSNQTRSAARRLGYAPPLAWDDDTIDDPATIPQHQLGQDHPARKRVHLDTWKTWPGKDTPWPPLPTGWASPSAPSRHTCSAPPTPRPRQTSDAG